MNRYWLRMQVHPTWHFTAFCGGIVMGVVTAGAVKTAGLYVAVFGCGLFLLSILRHRRFLIVLALVGGLLVGNYRGSIEQRVYDRYQVMYGKHVRLTGTIHDDIDVNAKGQAIIHLSPVSNETGAMGGKVWVTLGSQNVKNFKRGDQMSIDGVLQKGFGNYAASFYMPQVMSVARDSEGDSALALRDDFAAHVDRAIQEPQASLGIGFLLGQKRGLPEQLAEALQIAGLTHIIVASGYNLTILVRLARRLFENISKYLATVAGASLIIGFIAITGLSPSMTRAGLVAGLGLWAWYWGRRFHPFTLLVLPMALTVLWNPSYVWGDIGWALSFAAFGGVMLLAPLIQAYFYGEERPPFIAQLIIETLSAQIATAPIILLAFGQFSNIAIFSNLLILPFIPLAMVLVALAGAGAYILPAFAHFIGWPADILLKAMVWIIEKTASIEWAQSTWHINFFILGIWYAALTMVAAYLAYRTRFNLRSASIIE